MKLFRRRRPEEKPAPTLSPMALANLDSKRDLRADETEALMRLHADGRYCLDMSWGTRAPRFCGRPKGHDKTVLEIDGSRVSPCLYFSPLDPQLEHGPYEDPR